MVKYIVKKRETLESIAEDFGISVVELRSYHNNTCELQNLIGPEVKTGTELLLEKEKPSGERLQEIREEKQERQEEEKIQEAREERESHIGCYYVITGAQCICNKGTTPATLKVTSHTKVPMNDKSGEKYVATEQDREFEQGSSCFGSCKLRKNDPCVFSPAGKWQKPYQYVSVFDMKTLTEISYLNCTTGGKITVQYHGQKIKIGFMNLQRADAELLNQIMPGLELQEYKEEQDIDQYYI